MKRRETDIAELDPATLDVRIRFPMTERVIYTVVALICPAAVVWWGLISIGVSLLSGVIAGVLVAATILPFVLTAYRFEVRADRHEIYHREFVTRRILLEHVEQIRIAHETRNGIGWPVEHTKIEILGNGNRILVSWRSGKIAPLQRFLEQRFPHLVEDTGSLPDI